MYFSESRCGNLYQFKEAVLKDFLIQDIIIDN